MTLNSTITATSTMESVVTYLFPDLCQKARMPAKSAVYKTASGFRPDDTARAGSCRCSRRTNRAWDYGRDETQAQNQPRQLEESVFAVQESAYGQQRQRDQHSSENLQSGAERDPR